MLIRKYVNEDVKNINKLGELLHENYQFSKNEFLNCLVIEECNKIIGFVTYSVIYERGEIVDVVIEPKMRLHGYGLRLLNYVIDIITKKGCDNITLEVSSANTAAINLYKKLGFKIVTARKKYYGITDAYLMEKDLR